MTELKTLKDLENNDWIDCPEGFSFVDIDELKAEAVKWMREFEVLTKTKEDYIYECLTGNKITYSEEGKQSIKKFIKHFFNLTEEDLK